LTQEQSTLHARAALSAWLLPTEYYPQLVVSLSNHEPCSTPSFDKLRTSDCRQRRIRVRGVEEW